MTRARSKLAAWLVAISIFVAGAIGVLWWRRTATRPAELRLAAAGSPLFELFHARARDAGDRAQVPTWPLTIPEAEAQLLWTIQPGVSTYDPACYYRYVGGLDLDLGAFRVRTSADGYREDFERLPADLRHFVLVTGDSHTDGICSNEQSFANVCEARLRADVDPDVEVLNAGVSGYGFHNYVGALERLAAARPRVFVVAFYSGNDLLDSVYPGHYANRSVPPAPNPALWRTLDVVSGKNASVIGNALNQFVWFRANPDQEAFAVRTIQGVLDRIHQRCSEIGARFVLAHIPQCLTTDSRWRPVLERAHAEAGLTAADYERVRRMSSELLGRARANGDTVVDLEAALLADSTANYGDDLHISTRGQVVVADALTDILRAALREPRK